MAKLPLPPLPLPIAPPSTVKNSGSERAKKSGRRTLAAKRKTLLEELWGDELEQLKVWNRHEHDGYTTVPRTLTYIVGSSITSEVRASHCLKHIWLFGAEYLMKDLWK